MTKVFLIIGAVTVFINCKEEKKRIEKTNTQLDVVELGVEVAKSNCPNNKKDVAALFFEDGFDGDLVNVYLNGNEIFSKKIYTDQTLGFAEYVELGKLSEITELTIKINNSQKIDVLNQMCSFTFVNFIERKVSIEYNGIFIAYN